MAFVRTPIEGGFELNLPARYYRSRAAAMAALGLVVGSCCCCSPLGLMVADVGFDEIGALVLISMLLGGVVSVVAPIVAGVIALKSNTLAERSRVRVVGGVVWTHDGRSLPLTDINRFALVRRHDGIFIIRGWPRLVAYDSGGGQHALTEGVHPLFDGRRAAKVLERVAWDLGKPFRSDAFVLDLGFTASNCYVPIAGVFLFASVAALVFESGAKVRFAAKQSLLHFSLTLGFGFVGGVVCIATAFGAEAAGASPGLVVVPALLTLLVVFVMNVPLRFYAMFKASKDPQWVMPWLAPISRRWLSDERSAPPTRF